MISDGGPAFPVVDTSRGMSLRDWFAGQVIAGMFANGITIDIDGEHPGKTRAGVAYMIARAMLEARKVQP